MDLSLLDLPISEVRPDASKLPTTLLEKPGGLRLQVHFTENRPALNVRAFVFVINSTLPQPVSSIALRLEPLSEGLRIDLKPASDSNLAAFNPFAPQVAVTQIVLTETNCEVRRAAGLLNWVFRSLEIKVAKVSSQYIHRSYRLVLDNQHA